MIWRGEIRLACLGVVLVAAPVVAELKQTGDRTDSSVAGISTPADVILVIDNSGSMIDEISAIEDVLYPSLVAPLMARGIDPRIIVVSRHGADGSASVCFEEPLSSIPTGGCATPPAQPGITSRFKHYSVEVGSHNAWCVLMTAYDLPDEFALAPSGWSAWLRSQAYKLIIMVSDDGVSCSADNTYNDNDNVPGGISAAASFDADLMALAPGQFGHEDDRRYVVHSLVGMAASKSGDPWPPTEPVILSQCPAAVDAGTGHQALSVLTEGLRYPSCASNSYDAFMQFIGTDLSGRLLPLVFADRFEDDAIDPRSTPIQ